MCVSFDVVESAIPLFLGEETMKNWTTFRTNDSGESIINNKAHSVNHTQFMAVNSV